MALHQAILIFVCHPGMLCTYELKRNAQIARNRAKLLSLGIPDLAEDLRRAKAEAKARRPPAIRAEVGPPRRSSRKTIRLDLSEAALEEAALPRILLFA